MGLTKISTGGVKDDAASQAKIADEAIDEARLQVSNAGTNGQFLSKQSGNTGGLTWADANSYTHPNHSGEVTSTADGAQVIASNVVDEDNLKISNAGTNGQFLQKQSGNTGGLTWADVTIPPAGNTFTAVANGAIANNKAVKIDTDGKVSEIKSVVTTGNQHYGLQTNGYGQVSSADVYAFGNVIDYNSDDDMYVALSVESSGDFVYYTGVPNSNASSAGGITWSSRSVIHTGTNHRNVSICYAGNSRFLIVWREAQDTGLTKAVILKWNSGSSSASISSEQQIDGVSNSEYKAIQTVKIANDRVAILCRSDISYSKWPDGIPGVIIGDITNDTTWTYRNQQRCTATTNASDHGAKDEHYSIAYNSTDNIILCTWMKTAGSQSLRTVAMSVASGTSATITKGTDIELESGTQAGNQSTVWHSGQNKFVIGYTFDGSSLDVVRSKIATVDSSSLAITLSSAIDKTGLDIEETDYNLKLVLNNFGTIYAYFILTNNHIGVITAPDFNGSTLSWSNYSNNSSIYAGNYESVDIVMGGSGSEYRHVYFGEATSGNDTIYISYRTQQSASNLVSGEHYVGYADQAYTNGQTATIKTYGNHVDTLSGLTIGNKYYVQGDGTVGTSADVPVARAGLAIAADKLIIMYPADWGG